MSSDPASVSPKDLPTVVGPYRVIRELGGGRLGPLLLARHRPTGRLVALRVVKTEWACLPRYIARLNRDAITASLVHHPNLVGVIDQGEAQGRSYFALEYVEGSSLAERVKAQGTLAVPQAVAYVLQAARGLRFAHGLGMVHGDVRPGSLLLDRDGTTKLADLGLTATPATIDADDARPIPVGAEAQAEADAAPFRADVRGLGLTLAYLVTGKSETHPTALLAAGLPMNLIELIRSMIEPKPGGGDLAQIVSALERFLNGRGGSVTLPKDDDTAVLGECLRAFRASPSAMLRRRIIWGAVATCGVVVLLGLLARKPLFAASVLGLALLTALSDFAVAGWFGRSPLFPKVRALIVESRGGDWLIGLAAAVVFMAGLVALNLHGAWIAFLILALILAALMHVAFDKSIKVEQGHAIEEAQALLTRLRLQGVDEETLRRFVRTTAGDVWEEIFEVLFGYEAMLAAREPGERGLMGLFRRGRSLPWRDATSAWLDACHQKRRRARDWARLQLIEERGLVAEGVNLLTARRKARRIADALLLVSSQREPQTNVAAAVRQAFENPESILVGHERIANEGDSSRVLDLLLGPRTCFVVGALLLAGFLFWVHQNEVISHEQVTDVATRALHSSNPLSTIRDARIDVRLDGATKPLRLGFLPEPVARVFHGLEPGIAGLLLIVASLLGGSRVGWLALPGAGVVLLGPAFGLPAWPCMILGAGIPLGLILLGWTRDP